MIDYSKQEQDRVQAPVPDPDILFYGENKPKLDQMIELLRELMNATRRSESPNPTLIKLLTGNDTAVTFQTTVRYRCESLIVSSNLGAATLLAVRVGGATYFPFWTNAGVGPFAIPFLAVFEPGVDLTVWNVAANTQADGTKTAVLIWAYPELEAAR